MNARAWAPLVGALLAGAVAQAQDVTCDPAKTLNECINTQVFQFSRTLRDQSQFDAAASESAGLAAAKTANNVAEIADQPGTSTGGGQAKSGFTDLIPWLNTLGLLSDSDESDGTIAVDLNFLLLFKRKDAKHDSQLKWEFAVSPTVFQPLVDAIPEDVRDDRTKELRKKIKETADSRLEYTYSVITQGFGRDFRQHQREFSALIAPRLYFASRSNGAGGIDSAFDTRRAAFSVQLTQLLAGMHAADGAPVRPDTKFGALGPDEQQQLLAFVLEARGGYAQELAKHLDALQKSVSDPRIYQMAELVMQQPQILVTATKSIRDELVGPESWGAKVTYEKSLVDYNGFRKYARAHGNACAILADRAPSATTTAKGLAGANGCLDALGAYREAYAEQIENQSRMTFGLEYKQVKDWRYALPADGVDLDLPKHDRLIASAGFGRAVQRSAVKDRVDFSAAYDSNLEDDTNYKSRFVVTLTYTRRFGEMDIPFSIVYANKSEFLGSPDKQIGLHFGIKYRALDQE